MNMINYIFRNDILPVIKTYCKYHVIEYGS